MDSKQLRKAYGILALIAAIVAYICAFYGAICGFTYEQYNSERGWEHSLMGFGGAQIGFLVLSNAAIAMVSVFTFTAKHKNNVAVVTGGLITVILGMLPATLSFAEAILSSFYIVDCWGGIGFYDPNYTGLAIAISGMAIIGICNVIFYGFGIYNLCLPRIAKTKEKKGRKKEELEKQEEMLYEMARQAGSEQATAERESKEKPNINNEIFFLAFKGYVPADKLFLLRKAFQNQNEDLYTVASMLPLKNPQTTLLFSIFLGGLGVDRFYIGDTGLGIAKLLLNFATFGIWGIVDIFLTYKKAKENNLKEILNVLCIRS